MIRGIIFGCALAGAAFSQTPGTSANEQRLARHRNLGKAFYENPTTQNESVEQFRQALALAPGSIRERLNYGLALLRAGKTAEGVAELEAVQKRDPSLPHTWFNLAIEWKKSGEHDKALAQIAKFVELVPNEPIGRYNYGALLKIAGRAPEALREFERAAELDHNLAAARFQLYNAYRAAGRAVEAQRTLAEFQRLKKEQEGAAIPEDVDWCAYSEILDPAPPPLAPARPPVYVDRVVATGATGVSIVDGRIVPWLGVGRGEPLAAADYDNDGVTEIATVKPDRVELSKAGKVAQTFPGAYRAAVWLDYDHDYDLDLFLLGRESKLFRNQGKGGFVDRTSDFPFERGEAMEARVHRTVPDTRGLDLYARYTDRIVLYRDLLGGKYRAEPAQAMPPAPPLASDFDLDGREDLAVFDNGRVIQRLNRTVPRTNWIRVKLLGVRNPKRAMYAEVEVKAGRLYEKKVYYGEPLVFDLRNMATVDTVRITWPNGLIQNETNQAANRAYEYKEAQRLSGSCPIIWTWDGVGFRYITDVLGVAPLGAAAGDGKYFDTDHDEYIFISGDALKARAGKLEVRITEELSEVAYLDQVKLIAIDHPADVTVYHNDKWKAPPYPEHRLWGVRTRIPAKHDRDPYEFRREMNGIAEEHALTVSFPVDAPERGALVLRGWVDWADGSTFLAASQENPKGLVPPRLEARDASGRWIVVDPDMGMPAGKPKSIVVPVRFPSKYRDLRIVTNLCVYWDEIFLTPDTESPEHVSNTVALSRASLRFRGFSPSYIHPQRKQPERFSYAGATPTSLWNPTPGLYTRYGPVDSLLAATDDRMTVMGSGDEIALEFDAASLPALRPGWTRDYLLYVDGWAKDRDANTANGQDVRPLPFHSMSGYPLPKGERHPIAEYDREVNTRPALRLLRPLDRP
ncbi:MAG: hypothetical protein SFV18_04940 [Bryobacteraceae bacterium]|nr:hypothetical protein [Bryobacteraceae bacterium]